MDQNYSNSQNEFLWTLLANPANDAHLHVYDLQRLVNDFPQSGILQAMLAHASDEKNLKQASVYFDPKALYKLINSPSTFIGVADEKIITQNGIGGNGHYRYQEQAEVENPLLHTGENSDKSFHETAAEPEAYVWKGSDPVFDHEADSPSTVPVVDEHHITVPVNETETTPEPAEYVWKGSDPVIEHEAEQPSPAPVIDEHHIAASVNEIETAPEPAEYVWKNSDPVIEPASETPAPAPVVDEHHITAPLCEIDAAPDPAEYVWKTSDPVNEPEAEPPLNREAVDEHSTAAEVHEEGLAENLSTHHELTDNAVSAIEEPIAHITYKPDETASPELIEPVAAESENPAETAIAQPAKEKPGTVAHHVNETPEQAHEKHIDDETFDEIVGIENINLETGHNNFISFDKEFGEHKDLADEKTGHPAAAPTRDGVEHQDVSNYHDEKMPYTFMWWLDKTRKEHKNLYQPYVIPEKPKVESKPKKPADELQQQYFENIFHITSVEELDKSTPQPKVPFDIKRKELQIIDRFIKEEPQIKPQSSDKLDNENKAKKSSEDRDEMVTETLAAIYSDQMLYHKAIASYKKLILKFPEKSRYFAGKIEQLEKKTN